MKISVIIPTYKPQAYLWECLDSLVAQTFSKEDFEVVLVLNGCTEPWKSQIQEYIDTKMKGMNVKFIHTEQGGVSNARNIALDVAQGEYVTFIDDDDYVSKTFLASSYSIADNETVVLCKPYAFEDGKPEVQRKYRITDSYYKLRHKGKINHPRARKFFSGPWMKLIPMSFIQGRHFDTRFKNGEDSLFMFLISDRYKDVVFAEEDAVYFRRYRTGSAVTTSRSRKEIVSNEFRLLLTMLRIYIPRFWKYNFVFAMGNIMSTIHGMVECK